MASFGGRLRHAWNAFSKQDNHPFQIQPEPTGAYGVGYGARPHIVRPMFGGSKTIINSIYTRLGIDFSSVPIYHVREKDGRYTETMTSGLNDCLTVEANLDQAATAFRQDVAMTLFEKGVIAIVPVDTSLDPNQTGGYDINTLRVGEILQWYPKHVRVSLYNEKKGFREEVVLAKNTVAIVENPLYNVMNEPNSTLQRLIRKLSLLDSVDEQTSSGKLDIIIQLPYVIKSDARREQAEKRRKDIEMQLAGSQYGIAYTDGTERITQLNRPAENNLLKQVEYLQDMLYSQLGLTKEVFDGTADEKTMLNYHNRTIAPLLKAVTEAMTRSFLTKTARTQGQAIRSFRDPFSALTISDLAEIGDKLTRNEIATSNELRAIVGWKPSSDPKANELRNKNLPMPEAPPPGEQERMVNNQNET